MSKRTSRRKNRSTVVAEALAFQLDAVRAEVGLEAVVVADDQGLCVASAGDPRTCEEIAARLSRLGNKGKFEGVLLSSAGGWQVCAKKFEAADTTLIACALGKEGEALELPVTRSIEGITRILATAS